MHGVQYRIVPDKTKMMTKHPVDFQRKLLVIAYILLFIIFRLKLVLFKAEKRTIFCTQLYPKIPIVHKKQLN